MFRFTIRDGLWMEGLEPSGVSPVNRAENEGLSFEFPVVNHGSS